SLDACLSDAVSAAEDGPALLDSVTENPAATVGTSRGERLNGALEGVERLRPACSCHLEGLVVVIATHIALRHATPLSLLQGTGRGPSAARVAHAVRVRANASTSFSASSFA